MRAVGTRVWALLILLLVLSSGAELEAQQPTAVTPADTVLPVRDTAGAPGNTVPAAAAAPTSVLPGIPVDTLGIPSGDTIPDPTLLPDSVTAPEDSVGRPMPQLSASADSILQALRRLPGFIVTEYQGASANYRTDTGLLRLEGEAQVRRGGDQLLADTIEFNDRDEFVTAFGQARVISGTQNIAGDSLFYDLARRRATALGARTQIEEGATWYVYGDVTLEGTNHVFGSHARFTSCDLTVPHYHFEADEVMVIRDRILVARPARLYFGDVQVAVLPFVVQSLEQGRRSGFLTPRFGLSDIVRSSSGYNRQVSDVGFYWAINDYMGAQISTTWRSGAYTALMGNLQYSWRRQFLTGNLGLDRYWQQDGSREINLNTQSSWQPDERTSLSLSGRYASSSEFVRDATYDPREQTQDLNSSFSLGRRFDWGRAALGAERRQSIATGDVSMTLPSFSISPNSITLFDALPGTERWFSNLSITPGVISGSRATNRYAEVEGPLRQDQDITRIRLGPSFSVGNLTLSASGDLNRADLRAAVGQTEEGVEITLPAFNRDEANWSANASYRQQLIGTSSLSPNISLSQQLRRDTLTAGDLVSAPTRLSFGTGLNTDLYGFFPGVGPYTAIRHRFSPRLSYSYSPEVIQSELQERLFGRAGGRTQNRISLDITQSWEAKLETPTTPEEELLPADSLAGDSISRPPAPSTPSDPQKVTIISITTSPLEYDFMKAREEGSGFVTERVSNSISSDYLRGLTIQMQHDLFDKSELDPQSPETVGELGQFAPRLSSLSTSFELGPQSALFGWVERLAFGPQTRPGQTQGVAPGPPESGEPRASGQSAATGNPQGTGGGPWRMSVSYQYSRSPRVFTGGQPFADEAIQTLDGIVDFQLTPNWTVNWGTSYSITDSEFGGHRLNFRRDLHEWQANFSFFQAPNGNSAFEFYVELQDLQDLRVDYGERNLGVDRR